jgi:hypothetical protein
MKQLVFLFMGLFMLGTGRIAPFETILPQHPQIHDARVFVDGEDIVLEIDVVDDGAGWTTSGGATPANCAAEHTVELRTADPEQGWEVTVHDRGGESCKTTPQLPTFVAYVHGAMACDPGAQLDFYTHPFSHNGRSPVTIIDFAGDLTQLRSQGPFHCDLGPVPPESPNACWNEAAPDVRRAGLVGDAFWIDLVLHDGSQLFAGLAQKEGEWRLDRQLGDAGVCQGQLNHFISYSVETLNSPACAPPAGHYPPDEAELMTEYTELLLAICNGEETGFRRRLHPE